MQDKTKHKSFKIAYVRHAVQVVMLVLFVVPPLATGWALFGMWGKGESDSATPFQLPFFGSLSASDMFGISLFDPLAALEVIAASKTLELSLFVAALPILIIYALTRGRAFCGYVCPVGFLCELVAYLRSRLGLKPRSFSLTRHGKIYVAGAILVLSAVLSFPVFEALSPIGALNKGILFGSTAGLVTLIALFVVEAVSSSRLWCRSFCPVGGVFEVIGKVGQVNIACHHEACIACDKCKDVCLADPEILTPVIDGTDTLVRAGDCYACGNCIDVCPTTALSFKVGRLPQGNRTSQFCCTRCKPSENVEQEERRDQSVVACD